MVDTSEICRLESLDVGFYAIAPLARLSSSEPKILLIKIYINFVLFLFFNFFNFSPFLRILFALFAACGAEISDLQLVGVVGAYGFFQHRGKPREVKVADLVTFAADQVTVGNVAFIVSILAVLTRNAQYLAMLFKIMKRVIHGSAGDGRHNRLNFRKKLVGCIMAVGFSYNFEDSLALLSYFTHLIFRISLKRF